MLGPTASGKSDVAIAIAKRLGSEIISVDSMQVYRGMDIGTAKVDVDTRNRVPHHMIDVRNPDQDMAVAEFQKEGRAALQLVTDRGVAPIICGGSGLHFRSLVDPLRFPPSDPEVRARVESLPAAAAQRELLEIDPAAGDVIDMANPRRVVRALEVALVAGQSPSQRAASLEAAAIRSYQPEREFLAIGLDPGADLADSVATRFDTMLDRGLLQEVEGLRGRLGRLAAQAVGYKQLIPVVAGEVSIDEGRDAAIRATRALAKRQRTFFRRDPRIHWLPWSPNAGDRAAAAIEHLEAAWTS